MGDDLHLEIVHQNETCERWRSESGATVEEETVVHIGHDPLPEGEKISWVDLHTFLSKWFDGYIMQIQRNGSWTAEQYGAASSGQPVLVVTVVIRKEY